MESKLFDTVLIQTLVTLGGILLTAFLTYYFSQKRYTHEKLFDRKLTYLEEIYGKIISLEKDLKKYIHTTGAEMSKDSLSKKRKEIFPIQAKFFELQEFFWKKEIVLDESSVLVVQSFIGTSIEVLSKLQTSIFSQHIDDLKTSLEQWDSAFQVMKDKLVKAKKQLKDDFKNVTKK